MLEDLKIVLFIGGAIALYFLPFLIGLILLFFVKPSYQPSTRSSLDCPEGIGGVGDFPDEETAIEWSYK